MKQHDLAQLNTSKAAAAGFEFELRHPGTNEPLGMFIRVCGQDSDAYLEKQRELQRGYQRNMAKSRKWKLSPEEAERDGIEILAVATIGFRDLVLAGKPVEFSQQKVLELYSDPGFAWIREQVADAIQERENFLPSAATR